MKTKKLFRTILPVMMAVSFAVYTISCSKDDKDSGSLAGSSWQYVYSKTGTTSFYLQLDFTSETDGTIKTVMSANGVVTDASQPTGFTYEYDGENGRLDWDSSKALEFTVGGNKLTFDENTTVQVGAGIPIGGGCIRKEIRHNLRTRCTNRSQGYGQSNMKKFEYAVEKLCFFSNHSIKVGLNSLGSEGWEFVCVLYRDSSNDITIILKREKT